MASCHSNLFSGIEPTSGEFGVKIPPTKYLNAEQLIVKNWIRSDISATHMGILSAAGLHIQLRQAKEVSDYCM